MSIKKENLHFFNKTGDNLNLFYDNVSGLYRGNYVLSENAVSVELIESEQIIVLEKVYNSDQGVYHYVKPTSTLEDESEIIFEIDPSSQDNFFTFDITLDNTTYYINKGTEQVIQATYDTSFTDITVNGDTSTNIPTSYDLTNIKSDYNTANIGFSASEENSFIGKVLIYSKTSLLKELIGEVFFFVDTVEEDTRLPLLLETLGHTINNKDFLIFDTTNVNEDEIDFNVVNKKRKELLLEFNNIFPYLGSYKALINIIKYFGYESLSIKEYWKNVKVDSDNFGKLRPVDIESVLLNTNNTSEVSDLFPSKVYTKTNTFGMYYQITEESGEYDEDGLPITKESFDFTVDEILIKLFALKDKLKKYFLPLNSRIIDIIGEALYYSKIEINYWNSFNRIDQTSLNIQPTFSIFPSTYGFIEDLRPLEWVGTKIGPDLKLDGTTNLGVREFTLTDSFYDNHLEIYDSVSEVGFSITANYQETDEQNMLRLYQGLLTLGYPFNSYYINLDENKLLFVERFKTDAVIESKVEIGRYAGITPSLTPQDLLNGDQPVDEYKEAYLQYFFDRNFNVLELDNNEDIPVGYPILLKNTSFEVTWDDADVTWDSLDEKAQYTNYKLSTDNGFPTTEYNDGNDPYSGISWDDIGNSNFYELEWFIYKEEDENSSYWSNVKRGTLKDTKEYAVNLPYVGDYTVELTLYDMYGSFSRKIEKNYITVDLKNPNFTAWKIKDYKDLSWDQLDKITWDDMNSSWDLPFLPNTNTDDALSTWHGIDRVEFYQNLTKQDAILKSKGDINSHTWNNIGNDITWDETKHLYWDELSSTFTKFYVTQIGPTSDLQISVNNDSGDLLESVSLTRDYVKIPLLADSGNSYVDFVDQLYDLDEETYPILTSFIYEYRPIIKLGEDTIHQIVAVSKTLEKPNRYYFTSSASISDYNSELNGYGAVGDSSAGFDIYSSDNILASNGGAIIGQAIIGTNTIGATALVDDSYISINDVTYNISSTINTLSELANDLNVNSPFHEWEFNIVQSAQGGTGLSDEKILAYKRLHESNDINIIKYNKVYGTKYARSITTNATWNSLDVLYYQRDVEPFTQVYFNYDISLMPGFKNPVWEVTKVGTDEVVFQWLNKYMVYLFCEVGEYNVSLTLEDTNGNKKTVIKNGLIKVI